MSSFNNPFGEEDQGNINIDKLAEEMALTLKKLNNSKALSNIERAEVSDNSLGSLSQYFKTPFAEDVSLDLPKRGRQQKIISHVRKKVKTTSQNQANMNQQSQYNQSISNRKITDFFATQKLKVQVVKIDQYVQKQCSNQNIYHEISSINNHPAVKSLREKIAKKKKSIQELETQIQKKKLRNIKIQQETNQKLTKQQNVLINLISQKYSERIYRQRLKQNNSYSENKKVDILMQQIVDKIQSLKNKYQKSSKRNSKNRNLNQDLNFLDIYGEEKQNYFYNWKLKLESQKKNIEKQITRTLQMSQIEILQQKYYPLPQMLLDDNGQRLILQKSYLPLYSRSNFELINYNQICQVRVLNLKKLNYQNFLFITYPKTMKIQKRMELNSHLKQIYQKSLQLCDDFINSIFINNTIFTQISTVSQDFILIGRAVYEDELPTVTLKSLIKRYQCLPQNIARYIVKILVRAHERIKKQLNHQAIILPQNVIFNQKNDLRIENWIFNQSYRFLQYSENLIKDSKYLYLPPEYQIILYNEQQNTTGMGIWTIGVILYEILYGKKPFYYSHNSIDFEEFYVTYEIQFPIKPQVTDACKEFIRSCLCKLQNRIISQKALKHPFLDFKK